MLDEFPTEELSPNRHCTWRRAGFGGRPARRQSQFIQCRKGKLIEPDQQLRPPPTCAHVETHGILYPALFVVYSTFYDVSITPTAAMHGNGPFPP